MRGKRGQVWVETVIYTLIGLSVIAIVLSAALPKIAEKRDSIVIEQSIEALRVIDSKISQIKVAAGNRRIVDLEIESGELVVDGEKDEVRWVLDSSFAYSEVGVRVPLGSIDVLTVEDGGGYKVELIVPYAFDVQQDRRDVAKTFSVAPVPYRMVIENVGLNVNNKLIVNFVVS
jgi:type II secretory pathway pseudopilin PulG